MQKIVDKVVELRALRIRKDEVEDQIKEEYGIDVTAFVYSIMLIGQMVSVTADYDGSINIRTVCNSSTKQPETVEEFEEYIKNREEEETKLVELVNEIKERIWGEK